MDKFYTKLSKQTEPVPNKIIQVIEEVVSETDKYKIVKVTTIRERPSAGDTPRYKKYMK